MSNNEFRIAGALGLDPERDPTNPAIQEVLLHGIGFPLRPVSGTALTTTPDIGDLVAKGVSMQWMGNWTEGLYYPQGAFVRDGDWTMIANKLTLDKPAPVNVGDPSYASDWVTPGPPPTVQSNTSVVHSTQTYTFTKTGYIRALRVWVSELTANTHYRVVVVNFTDPDAPVTTVFEDPLLTENDWAVIALVDEIVKVGDVLQVTIDALNSGAETNISGGWSYGGPTQPPAAPPSKGWTQDNQRTSFRIDKFDLDGTDRSTELESVIPESTIDVVQTDNVGHTVGYRVSTVTDSGAFMAFGVVLQGETGGGPDPSSVCTLDINVPIPLATEYVEEVGKWPTDNPAWANVTSALEFDGVDQGVSTSGFGTDLEFQEAVASPDWDIVTVP